MMLQVWYIEVHVSKKERVMFEIETTTDYYDITIWQYCLGLFESIFWLLFIMHKILQQVS
jgi:hypothetical protein